jgi:hypothetical protein
MSLYDQSYIVQLLCASSDQEWLMCIAYVHCNLFQLGLLQNKRPIYPF